jgi:hypothetical protein
LYPFLAAALRLVFRSSVSREFASAVPFLARSAARKAARSASSRAIFALMAVRLAALAATICCFSASDLPLSSAGSASSLAFSSQRASLSTASTTSQRSLR